MKLKNLFILTFSLGVPSALYVAYLAIMGDSRFANSNYDNIFLKYSVTFFGLSLSFGLIIYPFLVKYGLCADFSSCDNVEKYKTRLFSYLIALPAVLFLCLTLATNGVVL